MPTSSDARRTALHLLGTYGLLILALLVECLVFEGIARHQGSRSFLSPNSLILILNHSAVYGVMSVGMTFVIISGGIDLSIGSMVAFGGVICATIVQAGGEPAWLWIAIGWLGALAAGAIAGGFAGTLITWFEIPPFIATLALMSSLRGLGYIIAQGQPISNLPDAYTVLGRNRVMETVPISVVLMLAVVAGGAVLLNQTQFGRHVRAIGGNEEAARLSGVKVRRVKWLVYCMGSTLAVLGGLILSSKLGSGSPKVGMGDELGVIAAVVVGGTSLSGGRGTIGGSFVGLLIISVLTSGLNWIGVEFFAQMVVLGLVILAAVLLDHFKRT
ncbi:MAG TPA: ABC transporter permease [Candidatus Hydrogenedentes bacterium]|nr:ABC transporter permease [Candidatus Hydrogenedentota bacterium]